MQRFDYRARNIGGDLIVGEMDGNNSDQIKEALAARDLFPISVMPKPIQLSWKRFLFERKPKPKDLANLTVQLHAMYVAGVTMDRIFVTLIKQTENKILRQALEDIYQDVSAGAPLSQAFRKHPACFDKLFVSMIRAGEEGGILDKTLKELSSVLEKEYQIKSKVKSATLYPKIVLVSIVAVTWLVLTFVIPKFQAFYDKYNAELPLPSRILLAIGSFLTEHWYAPIIAAIAGYYAFRYFSKTTKGKWWLGLIELRVPVFGTLTLRAENARFGHLVSSLYRAGLPFSYAISVTADTVSNVCFAKDLLLLKERIEQGLSISDALEKALYFSPMLREMCIVGEESGKIDETLESTAAYYDEEVDRILKNISTLIEPALLVLLFGAVLLLALAVYLPIWNLSNVVMPH